MFPLKDTNPSRSLPIVTWLLILANVIVFLAEVSMDSHQLSSLIKAFGVIPAQYIKNPTAADEITTIFTSMFLHGGWLHLIMNMWALWIFGDNVEDRLGHAMYLIFYLGCGVVAALTQVFFDPAQTAPTIGASGAIAGILGAYVMLFPGARVTTLIPIGFIPWFINIPAYFYLGFWFVTQAFTGFLSLHSTAAHAASENIAFMAHVGGFVTGFLLVRLFQRRDHPQWHPDEYQPY
jgi:membrane associated rhomboid family serine protease